MSEPSEPFHNAARLGAEAREAGAAFLLNELHVGLAMLDTAEASADRTGDARRRALALEAYHVVTERLARMGDPTTVLTDAERDEVTRLRHELRTRLEAVGVHVQESPSGRIPIEGPIRDENGDPG